MPVLWLRVRIATRDGSLLNQENVRSIGEQWFVRWYVSYTKYVSVAEVTRFYYPYMVSLLRRCDMKIPTAAVEG